MWRGVRRHWYVIVLAGVLGAGGGYAWAGSIAPQYEATASVAYSAGDMIGIRGVDVFGGVQDIRTGPQLVLSERVAERVRDFLPDRPSPTSLLASMSAQAVTRLGVIRISAKSADPDRAAVLANAFAAEFVAVRTEDARAMVVRVRESMRQRLAELTPQEAASGYGRSLKERYDDLGIQVELQGADYKLSEPGLVPTTPMAPEPPAAAQIGGLFGLLLGVGLTQVREVRDRRVREEATIAEILDLPVLARTPLVGDRWGGDPWKPSRFVGFRGEGECLLEPVRMLRFVLMQMGVGTKHKTLLFTSLLPNQGKSTTALNLALVMAEAFDNVALVDADVRRSGAIRSIGLKTAQGLSDILRAGRDWRSVLQTVKVESFMASAGRKGSTRPGARPVLPCLTTGAWPRGSPGLIETTAFEELMGEMGASYGSILINGGALLVGSDTMALHHSVDAIVVVARIGVATDEQLRELRSMLDMTSTPILGLVFTGERTRPRLGAKPAQSEIL